ncbi:MAG: glutamate-5-semialdehyde dehydrogenase [Proteobacteria bacterium]|nr:glutamate-5-semialdehyde dehydrogenase [Pseudomonadota bacterium]
MTLTEQFKKVKESSYQLALVEHDIKQKVVEKLADKLISDTSDIIAQNQLDLAKMSKEDPKYDRLLLTKERIYAIAMSLKTIAIMDSPIWQTLESYTLANGLYLEKKTVPLGVIGIIYEARPNVTLEAFVLCFMSSNACILKGGMDAQHTNDYFGELILTTLQENKVPACLFLMPAQRETVKELLNAKGLVDLIIPRGSQALIDFVKQNTTIPIIETGAGVVHTYVDSSADVDIAQKVITNAKTRRVSVCNALDCLIVHKEMLPVLQKIVFLLKDKGVKIYADDQALAALQGHYPEALLSKATPQEYGKEFLSMQMAIKTVDNLKQAILHIRQYSSGHSEAIIAEDHAARAQFFLEVDAAVVYANTSTAFTDGGEFGMGGEIGISTQKLHVRGPFSMQHLVSTKWLVSGRGQVRA